LDNFFLIENKGSKFINNDLDFDWLFNLKIYIINIYII
jgi:hypothetical protein